MQTVYLKIDPDNIEEYLLAEPAEALKKGELVVMPTETVYGLGVNALMATAVPNVYKAKGRPSDNPLIVHVADFASIKPLVGKISPLAEYVMRKYMPGPLTAVLPKSDLIPDEVSAGLPTVGIRMPAHPIAHHLIKMAGVPVAAPSANLSGKPSLTNGPDCLEDLSGRVKYIIDGGESQVGLESTVVDFTGEKPIILRPGKITADDIERAIEEFRAEIAEAETEISAGNNRETQVGIGYMRKLGAREKPVAPGMKYRHYAPEADIKLIEIETCSGNKFDELDNFDKNYLDDECFYYNIADKFMENILQFKLTYACGEIGIFIACEIAEILKERLSAHGISLRTLNEKISTDTLLTVQYGKFNEVEAASHKLFAALRSFDRNGIKIIITHTLPKKGLGVAYMNRLIKAAGKT